MRILKIIRRVKAEFDKGPTSPPVGIAYLLTLMYFAWYIFKYYLIPYQSQTQEMPFRQRIPFADSHNAFFGIMPALTDGRDPASAVNNRDVERPGFVATERSEAYNVKRTDDGAPLPPAVGDQRTDLVVAQVQDWDDAKQEEVYYRSLHYVTTGVAKPKTQEEINLQRRKGMNFSRRSSEPEPLGGTDKNRLAGMVRCKALSPTNNCIADGGHLDLEYMRKMMAVLGPMYMLRNPLDQYIPFRVTNTKEVPANILVCGLGGGSIPSFLNRNYTHMKLDVCEKDATVVRLARKYLGFREMPGMNLFLEEPSEFLRRMQVAYPNKYDVVFVDCLHDATGRVPIEYSRLEFLTALRNSMSRRGVVVANLPNRDEKIFQSTVANWRMAFDGRTVILIHCSTSPNTILMTFSDDGDRGEPRFGVIKDVHEFKELLRVQLRKFPYRVTFDLPGELNENNFQQMEPDKRYYFTQKDRLKDKNYGRLLPSQGPEGPYNAASEAAVWATSDPAMNPYATKDAGAPDSFMNRFANFYSKR